MLNRSTIRFLARFCVIALLVSSAAPAMAQQRAAQAPAEAQDPVTGEEQKTVIDRIAVLLAERYVFEDKGREAGQHIQTLLADGAFRETTDPVAFATALTEALQSVTHDKHMRVRLMRPQGPGMAIAGPSADPADRLLNLVNRARQDNYGFEKVASLPGNVGYIKLNGFAGDPAAMPTAAAAMNLLAGCDALIVDLRENGGGDPEMIRYISSYLFDQPTHLNSLYWRQGDRTQEFWTRTDVSGERVGQDVPLYVLTAKYTFSGGEEFAYNIQTQKRGTLIGETTGGGANPGGVVPAGRFAIFIPTGRAINPITKTNWEGVGVKPEIEMPAAEAYNKAVELATAAAEERRERQAAKMRGLREAVVEALRTSESQLKESQDGRNAVVAAALEQAVAGGAMGEVEINLAGYGYLEAGRLAEALALLRFSVDRYPESPNVHDSYGEALETLGRLKEAQAAYRKAYELGTAQQDGQTSTFKQNLDRVSKGLAGE